MVFEVLELTDEGLPFSLVSKTIKDTVHDYISVGDHELAIIDSPFFQRLRRVRQLQTAYLVYPGAEHSRLQHSLGVMHLAGKFAVALIRNTFANRGVSIDDLYVVPKMHHLEIDDLNELIAHILAVRVAGLIHDIGHGPFSHAFDEAIISESKELQSRGIYSHEDLGFRIFRDYLLDPFIASLDKKDLGISIDTKTLEECIMYISSPRKSRSEFKCTRLCQGLLHVVREFIYPSDILDFTIRDAYYSGAKEFGMVDADRLMRYSVIIMDNLSRENLWIAPFENALNTLRAFLYSRFWLFNNVYFHKVSRIFDLVIKNVLRELNSCVDLEGFVLELLEGEPSNFYLLDDFNVLYMAKRCEKAWHWARMVLNRILPYKEIYRGEMHLRSKESVSEEAIVKNPPRPEKIAEEIKNVTAETLNTSDESIVVDYPHVRFFPDNPYLAYGSLILLDRQRGGGISHRHVSISNIIFGSALDFTVLRIFVKTDVYKRLSEEKIKQLRERLEREKLVERFNRSLIYHWGANVIGVTM